MKTKFLTSLFLLFTLAAFADGPIYQVSPFMQQVLNSPNSTAAQTALGFAGGTIGLQVMTNIASSVPATTSTNSTFLQGYQPTAFVPALTGPNAGLSLWLSAQQQYMVQPGLTNKQPLLVQDFSPSNCIVLTNVNSSGTVQFDDKGMNGTPGLYFPSSSAELEVSNFWLGVTSFTMEITYKDADGTNNEFNDFMMTAGGWGVSQPYCFRLSPWVDGGIVSSLGTGGSLYFATATNGTFLPEQGVSQAPNLPHVFIFQFDGTNAHSFFDGYMTMDSTIQPIAAPGFVGMLAQATNLYIGGQITGGSYYWGDISDLRIYKNNSSGALRQYLLQQCGSAARLPQNSLIMDGDSIAFGLYADAPMGSWNQMLNGYFPGVNINTVAASGRTSAQDTTNAIWYGQCKNTGRNVAIHYIDVNDFGPNISGPSQVAQVPITLANDTNIFMQDFSNNITPIFCTLASVYFETNSIVTSGYDWRSNLNATIRSWTNLGVGIVDIGATAMGTNGAYANPAFFASNGGQEHPNAGGYSLMTTSAVPVIQMAFYGYPPIFKGNTINLQPGNALLYAGLPILAANTNGNLSVYPTYVGGAGMLISSNVSVRTFGAGTLCLAADTNDNGSVAIGAQAMQDEPSSSESVAIGWGALAQTIINVPNATAIGFFSQVTANTDANGANTSVGSGSLENLSNGHANTAIGNAAGYHLTSGSYNIYIGDTGEPTSESDTTRIGTPGITGTTYIQGTGPTVCTNGFTSFCQSGPLVFGPTGVTNNTSVQYEICGFTSVNNYTISNSITGRRISLMANSTWGTTFILQPGDAIISAGTCNEVTNFPF